MRASVESTVTTYVLVYCLVGEASTKFQRHLFTTQYTQQRRNPPCLQPRRLPFFVSGSFAHLFMPCTPASSVDAFGPNITGPLIARFKAGQNRSGQCETQLASLLSTRLASFSHLCHCVARPVALTYVQSELSGQDMRGTGRRLIRLPGHYFAPPFRYSLALPSQAVLGRLFSLPDVESDPVVWSASNCKADCAVTVSLPCVGGKPTFNAFRPPLPEWMRYFSLHFCSPLRYLDSPSTLLALLALLSPPTTESPPTHII